MPTFCKITPYELSQALVGREIKYAFRSVEDGGPQQRSNVLDRLRVALKAAHLDERRTFHDLRHCFGTRMAGAGVPMRTLQEWMGHRDIATTQIYADDAPNPQEAQLAEAAFAPRGSNRTMGPRPSPRP